MAIQLKINKWYQTRDKRLIKIIEQFDDKHCIDPFRSSDGRQYYPDGSFKEHVESKCDIVREVSHVGDLLELVNEEGAYYKIKGSPNEVQVEIRKNPNPRISVECGKYDNLFETLLSAYLKFKEHN